MKAIPALKLWQIVLIIVGLCLFVAVAGGRWVGARSGGVLSIVLPTQPLMDTFFVADIECKISAPETTVLLFSGGGDPSDKAWVEATRKDWRLFKHYNGPWVIYVQWYSNDNPMGPPVRIDPGSELEARLIAQLGKYPSVGWAYDWPAHYLQNRRALKNIMALLKNRNAFGVTTPLYEGQFGYNP